MKSGIKDGQRVLRSELQIKSEILGVTSMQVIQTALSALGKFESHRPAGLNMSSPRQLRPRTFNELPIANRRIIYVPIVL